MADIIDLEWVKGQWVAKEERGLAPLSAEVLEEEEEEPRALPPGKVGRFRRVKERLDLLTATGKERLPSEEEVAEALRKTREAGVVGAQKIGRAAREVIRRRPHEPGLEERIGEAAGARARRIGRRILVEPGTGKALAKGLAPLRAVRIKRGPQEKGLRELIEARKVTEVPTEEPDMLEEALDFEPFGEPTDTGADVMGTGLLTDPFEEAAGGYGFGSSEDFTGGLLGSYVFGVDGSPRGRAQIVEAQEISVKVPGGLTATHILKDSQGRIGYRMVWQGQAIDWFPEKTEAVSPAGVFG